ncbi:MAG: SCP2 sterol-binding domain-containing protein, partial [Ectothiorhodospiraceae bacterium]|nr:SCP2 sterol-binding domain-containing protein [Ectothiorhodospiraceae bacterium]
MHWLDLPLQAASRGISQLIRLDPEGLERLAALDGRSLAIDLETTGLRLLATFGADGLQLRAASEEDHPDATIRGKPADMLALARDPEAGGGAVHFSGDLGLVRSVRTLFARLDGDWEEQIARVLGDIPAHQLGRLARSTLQWLRDSHRSLETNLAEYLTEERRTLPTAAEVEIYLSAVDRLREDADRMQARIRRLEQ